MKVMSMASLDLLCTDPGHAFICYVKMLRETFLKKSTKDSCFHCTKTYPSDKLFSKNLN